MNNGNVSVRLLGKTYKGFQHIGPLRKTDHFSLSAGLYFSGKVTEQDRDTDKETHNDRGKQ